MKGKADRPVGIEPASRGFIEGDGRVERIARECFEKQLLPFTGYERVVVDLSHFTDSSVDGRRVTRKRLSLGG